MGAILTGKCIQVNMQANDVNTGEVQHVFHVSSPNAEPTYDECLAVATAVHTWWHDTYIGLYNINIVGSQVVATSLAATDAPQATVSAEDCEGDRPGTPMPTNVTLALKKTTQRKGRRNRGRFFVWPSTEPDLLNDGTFTDVYVGEVLSAFLALLTDLDTAGHPMVIRSTAATSDPLHVVQEIVAVDHFVDSRRRRLKGRGA